MLFKALCKAVAKRPPNSDTIAVNASSDQRHDVRTVKATRRFFTKTVLVAGLTFFLLTTAALHVSAKATVQTITFNGKDVSLEKIFLIIKQQTGYVVFFDYSALEGTKPVTIAAKNMPLQDFLDKALQGQSLGYYIKKKTIFIKKAVVDQNNIKTTGAVSSGQQTPSLLIRGVVKDESGNELAGATVTNKNSNFSVATDGSGAFSIEASEGDILVFTFVGYSKSEVKIGSALEAVIKNGLQISLKRVARTLENTVISTGFQQLPRERSTGSFEQIDRKLLNRTVSTDILSRLDGVANGMFFSKNNSGSDITIRGISSLTASIQTPLVVLDNLPYEGSITNINPNDIESVSILKDAAAASIWGARAGNGVIVITTRQSHYNRPLHISFNSNLTIGSRPNLNYLKRMNSSDFIDVEQFLFSKGFYDADINNTTDRPVLSPVVETLAQQRSGNISEAEAKAKIQAWRAVDAKNEFLQYLYQPSVKQQYALSLNGGGQSVNYMLSAGYDGNKSDEKGNVFRRLTLREELNLSLLKGLELNTGMILTQVTEQQNSPGNFITISTGGGKGMLYPYAQLADDNGTALPIAKNYRIGYTDTAGGGKLLNWQYKPLDELSALDARSGSLHLLVKTGLKYRFSKQWNTEVRYQYERNSATQRYYSSLETYKARDMVNRFTQLNGSSVKYNLPMGGIMEEGTSRMHAHSLRGQLNYSLLKGEHQVNALMGGELRQIRSYASSFSTYGFDADKMSFSNTDFVNLYPVYGNLTGPSLIPSGVGFTELNNRYVSWFANAGYTYKNRYTLTGSIRKDASNLFGVNSNQKGVPLWSAGAAWTLSNESFYQWHAFSLLKLRATYGSSGNVNNSLSAYTTITYFPAAGNTVNTPYAGIRNPGNPDLKWEKVSMANFGLDFSTHNARINGSLEYYVKVSKDLLAPAPLDATTGFTSATVNSGEMMGKGVDLSVNSLNTVGAISWETNLILNYNKSKITKYLQTFKGSIYVNRELSMNPLEGKSPYGIYSYAWQGLSDTGDPQGWLENKVSKEYTAIIDNTTVDQLVYDGSSRPPFFGSLRNTVSYKNFSLSANITYSFNYKFRRTSINYTNLYNLWINHSDYARRWQQPGDEKITSIPSMVYPGNAARDEFYTNAAVLIDRADHVRLQDLQISYQFTKKTNPQQPVNVVQLYINANNLGILWRANEEGIDPAYGYGIPAPRQFSIGIRADL